MKTTAKTVESSPTITKRKTTNRPPLSALPTFMDVAFHNDQVWFVLSDGRTVIIPLAWSKLLQVATPDQRLKFVVSAYNIFWDELDEIIGIENVLYGQQGLYL